MTESASLVLLIRRRPSTDAAADAAALIAYFHCAWVLNAVCFALAFKSAILTARLRYCE
jgi:hypothetical protein